MKEISAHWTDLFMCILQEISRMNTDIDPADQVSHL